MSILTSALATISEQPDSSRIEDPCNFAGCTKAATKILLNNKNAEIGRFCIPHAKMRLNQLLQSERAESNDRSKNLDATRAELELAGFMWIATRPCKRCGSWIEIWSTPAHTIIAIEMCPELDWRFRPHAHYCKVPKPAKQEKLFV